MKEIVRLVLVVGIFCLVSGLLLAWTNNVTKAAIEEAKKAELLDTLNKVLPKHDNDVSAGSKSISENGREMVFYVATLEGKFAGTAFQSASPKGYGGPIEVLAGILPDGTINAVEILKAEKETPGLGLKIRDQKFIGQFKGRSARDASWAKVAKDGGKVQGITGATISSRAVCEAVRTGVEIYAKHAGEIAACGKAEEK